MIWFGRYFCPNCGKDQLDAGRFGTSRQCDCGIWIDQGELDKAGHYWLFQIAVTHAAAVFFLAMALFFRDLPDDSWQRLLSPVLQAPAIATLVVGYRMLVRYKQSHDNDDATMRFFWWGIAAALLVAILD